MILLIDNYDSFSYNLYQYIGEIHPDIRVVRNDELTPEEIRKLQPSRIVISPGPGRPEDAGNVPKVISSLAGEIPILGVCLGHQAICQVFGAKITYAKRLMHGKRSMVTVDTDCPIFVGCPKEIEVARYHSLAAENKNFPNELQIVAKTKDDEVMAVMHRKYPIYGVQFHPESILTPMGKQILENFING